MKAAAELVTRLALDGCERVRAFRLSAWLPTAHPELWGTQIIWTRDGGTEVVQRPHGIHGTPVFQGTPGQAVLEARRPLRWRLGPDDELPFEVLREVRSLGGSDYLIVPFGPQAAAGWVAWATDAPDGFTDADVACLVELSARAEPHLALAVADSATASLLTVYLGANAADRVMKGAFKRGTGTEIDAALWFCDLRGFTTLSDTLPAKEVVALLDRYFECVGGPIEESGGEILKFIGDAVLAVFPFDPLGPESACTRALSAAQEAHARLRAVPPLHMGVALHAGQVLYGNVGAQSRLDFTVIGRAVNEVCRVEALCKELGTSLLLTRRFADQLPTMTFRSLGEHVLRGVSGASEVLTV